MYIDDSGTSSINDDTEYYVISGVVINDVDLHWIESKLENFRNQYFTGQYKNEEIHLHAICQNRGNFKSISKGDKKRILDGLYNTVSSLSFQTITVGINKKRLENEKPNWDIFKVAWTFLIERFEMYLTDQGMNEHGRIIADKSDSISERNLRSTFKYIFKNGTSYVDISHINSNISIFPSNTHYGLQLADSISYCTLQNLKESIFFERYWNIVQKKIRSCNGKTYGYGYKIFPN